MQRKVLFVAPDEGLAPRQRVGLFREAIREAGFEESYVPLPRRLADSAGLVERLDETIRTLQPTALCFTTGPFPAAMAGAIAASDVWNLPTLLDFRDPWLSNPFTEKPLKQRLGAGWVLSRIQKAALKRSYVTAASSGILNEMFSLGARIGTVVLTGVGPRPSEDDLAEMSKILQQAGVVGPFCAYAGGLVGKQYPLASCLGILEKRVGMPIVIAGDPRLASALVEKVGAAENVVVLPALTPRLVLALHASARVSLIIEGEPGLRADYSIPVKVFDFLASANAVAGWLPEGSEGRSVLLQGMANVHLVRPGDVEALTEAVRRASRSGERVDFRVPKGLTRSNSRERLAEIISSVAIH